jgi:hypothetical protein
MKGNAAIAVNSLVALPKTVRRLAHHTCLCGWLAGWLARYAIIGIVITILFPSLQMRMSICRRPLSLASPSITLHQALPGKLVDDLTP